MDIALQDETENDALECQAREISKDEMEVHPPAVNTKAGSIQAIDKSSVHRICSGQVVLNLATAVKELVENSLDAGATSIEVRLKEHGAESIEVIDNGSGVLPHNFAGLTLKHHTSKLREFADLTGVETFGFRGEALSSLCALSKLWITTRHESQSVGTRLEYDHAGILINSTACPRQVGTTVQVCQLFSTLPVRLREFQRHIKREFSKMAGVMSAYALVATGVRLTASNQNGKGKRSVFVSTNGNQNVRENITNVFGAKQVSCLLEIRQHSPTEDVCVEYGIKPEHSEQLPFKLSGFISTCVHGQGRGSSDRQFIFINGRPCDLAKMTRVVNEVYHSFNRHQYPFLMLEISLEKDSVDVNVTPDKRQIFLQHERLLLATLKTSLQRVLEPYANVYDMKKPEVKSHSLLHMFATPPPSSSAKTHYAVASQNSCPNMRNEKTKSITATLAGLKRSFSSAFSKDENEAGLDMSVSETSVTKQSKLDDFVTAKLIDKSNVQGNDDNVSATQAYDNDGFTITYENDSVDFKENCARPEDSTRLSAIDNSIVDYSLSGENIIQRHASETNLGNSNDTHRNSGDSFKITFENTGETLAYEAKDNHNNASLERHIGDGYEITFESTGEANSETNSRNINSSSGQTKCMESHSVGDEDEDYLRSLQGQLNNDHQDSHTTKKTTDKSSYHIIFDEGPTPSNNNKREDKISTIQQKVDSSSVIGKQQLTSNVEVPSCTTLTSNVEVPSCTTLTSNVEVPSCTTLTSNVEVPSCTTLTSNVEVPSCTTLTSNVEVPSCTTLTSNVEVPSCTTLTTNVEVPSCTTLTITEVDKKQASRRKVKTVKVSMEKLKTLFKSRCSMQDKTGEGEEFSRTFRAKIAPNDNQAAEEELRKTISIDMFPRMRILGQFNLGFIITRLGSDLFIIDQHATDEKYNFETLQRDVIIDSQRLILPQRLELTAASETLLIDNEHVFTRNGFQLSIDHEAPTTQKVRLVAAPVSRNWNFGKDDIDELLFMLSDTPGVMCRPSRVRAMFASRACRKSIMIGTALNKSQMRKLVNHMAEIEQPWNCPHGRPTMRHLINLNMLPQES